jgi:hypothetical protein
MNDLATTNGRLAPDNPGSRANPLKLLPDDWREPVSFFYAVYSDSLKGTAGLVARFRLWMKDDGLTLDEAKAVMKRLMKPARAAAIQYAGQLMAALAEEVAAVVAERHRVAEELARRRQWAADDRRYGGTGDPLGMDRLNHSG